MVTIHSYPAACRGSTSTTVVVLLPLPVVAVVLGSTTSVPTVVSWW